MSQKTWLLEQLRKGPVTPIQALKRGGIFRLAARVQDLRNDGHTIVTQKVEQNGKSFARYVMTKGRSNA